MESNWSATHSTDYTAGQRVRVLTDEGTDWWVGTIVNYWRNGNFLVDGPKYDTPVIVNIKNLRSV